MDIDQNINKQQDIKFFDDLIKNFIKSIPTAITPNHITLLRFFLMMAMVWLFLTHYVLISFVVFLVVSFTDAIDGALARQRRQITQFGAIFDPLIDKALIIILIILFANYIPWQIITFIIVAEFSFVVGSFVLYQKKINIRANNWGKLKMACEILAILLLFIKKILEINQLNQLIIIIFSLAIIFALLSFGKQYKVYKVL